MCVSVQSASVFPGNERFFASQISLPLPNARSGKGRLPKRRDRSPRPLTPLTVARERDDALALAAATAETTKRVVVGGAKRGEGEERVEVRERGFVQRESAAVSSVDAAVAAVDEGAAPAPRRVHQAGRWGEAEVVASGSWRLRVEPSLIDGDDHLGQFLRLADETYPELELGEGGEVWLLFAGWGSRFYRPLPRIDPRNPVTREFAEAEGFGATRLRVGPYLDALAASSARLP